MNFLLNKQVKVESYYGAQTSSNEVGIKQNYWKLIGYIGKVIRKREIAHLTFNDIQLQLLVQFGDEVNDCNLSSPNEEKNSFWILYSDLEVLSTTNSTCNI